MGHLLEDMGIMAENVVTMVSTEKYKEGWDRIFGGEKRNLWRCPKCKMVVGYGEGKPDKRTWCSKVSQYVKMIEVKR